MTGAQVRLRGIRVDGALALTSGTTSIETLSLDSSSTSTTTTATPTSAALPNTFGAQNTLVILVNFQDNPTEPYTPAFVQNLVFTDVSNFYRENSFQQTWLSGTVLGWYTIPVLSTSCDAPSIATEANKAATSAGADLSLYSRFVYMFPKNACTWSGLAWMGSPTQAFVNRDFTVEVVGHELGHNLGLWHSHGLYCDTSPLGDNCQYYEYGDRADIMGGRSAHFNSFQKERLGWLNNGAMPPITTVQTSGNYTLDPY